VGRYTQTPKLYNDTNTLTIKKLTEWGYIGSTEIRAGSINWLRNDVVIDSISIISDFSRKYIELFYNYGDLERNYKIELIPQKFNLGKGTVYYFRCPETHKPCRILYFSNGRFLHKDAAKGFFYEKQTFPKKKRKIMCSYIESEKALKKKESKYFKTHYNGRPTKRYLNLNAKIADFNKYNRSIEELLCF
jgi:hypothetical protein